MTSAFKQYTITLGVALTAYSQAQQCRRRCGTPDLNLENRARETAQEFEVARSALVAEFVSNFGKVG